MIIMLLCNIIIIMSERKSGRERECKGETFLGVLIIWSTPNYIHMRVETKWWNKNPNTKTRNEWVFEWKDNLFTIL